MRNFGVPGEVDPANLEGRKDWRDDEAAQPGWMFIRLEPA